MRVLTLSLTACVATLMIAIATPATSQPSALALGQGKVSGVEQIDHRHRRKGDSRRYYGGYYGPGPYYGPYYAPYAYYGPYYDPYYYPYYYPPHPGSSVSFSFGF
jgi:hypothetical protein